ncbi:MAG: hypothetical protein WAM14_21510, partial [Candidatus Nitrosopolaris sp.]
MISRQCGLGGITLLFKHTSSNCIIWYGNLLETWPKKESEFPLLCSLDVKNYYIFFGKMLAMSNYSE